MKLLSHEERKTLKKGDILYILGVRHILNYVDRYDIVTDKEDFSITNTDVFVLDTPEEELRDLLTLRTELFIKLKCLDKDFDTIHASDVPDKMFLLSETIHQMKSLKEEFDFYGKLIKEFKL